MPIMKKNFIDLLKQEKEAGKFKGKNEEVKEERKRSFHQHAPMNFLRADQSILSMIEEEENLEDRDVLRAIPGGLILRRNHSGGSNFLRENLSGPEEVKIAHNEEEKYNNGLFRMRSEGMISMRSEGNDEEDPARRNSDPGTVQITESSAQALPNIRLNTPGTRRISDIRVSMSQHSEGFNIENSLSEVRSRAS
eukprot:CAMPEP_0205807472 /NCGR_PEP_ID=MMETSP0205-20121125/11201_1 /ASSEMBLY_ACC=CAM_ASM_000278 /TAXON_ID=36767 /ORGANISM="Euplotes focardii, Strain TN1" /LENGTH=193 /DNA_ID=CAMNT_0053081735 /DNA_START=853 /DNA_END=1431 /DNA_ORIENTATION=+